MNKETIIDGKWFEKIFSYNTSGVLASISYKTSESPSIAIGAETYTYGYEHLKEIKFAGATVWKLDVETSLGKPSQVTTGGLTRTYTYDQHGIPTGRTTKNGSVFIQNFSYNIDSQTGNLNWRKDNSRNIQEDFTYDKMNRLTSFGGKIVKYSANGNILDISSIGAFGYNLTKPYAIAEFTPYGNSQIPLRDQTITYNSQMRPLTVAENNYATTFSYNSDGTRIRMVQKKGGVDDLTRYYLNGGQYEIDKGVAGAKERLYLGGNAYSAAAVYVKDGGSWSLNYICRDYLGSITHVTNASGTVRQELSYDAWGRLRNPSNQTIYAAGSEPSLVLGRGYTGHEHLTMYGLINMNARLYDPILGRFLSADPYVQEMYNSQNFNRYSYCLNNPLKYSDESGELFGFVSGLFKAKFNFWKGLVKCVFNDGNFKKDVVNATIKPIVNGAKIDAGMFIGDPKQIISRWTWELPQTLAGNAFSSARNVAGSVDQVKYYKGATFIIHDNSSKHNGVTLGSYINMNIKEKYTKEQYQPSWNGGKFTPVADNMMMHEYGHYLQSQILGWFYLPVVGAPSLLNRIGWIGTSDKNYFFTEKWANNLAYDHFVDPSIPKGPHKWDFTDYPLKSPSDKSPFTKFPWINQSSKMVAGSSPTINSFKY